MSWKNKLVLTGDYVIKKVYHNPYGERLLLLNDIKFSKHAETKIREYHYGGREYYGYQIKNNPKPVIFSTEYRGERFVVILRSDGKYSFGSKEHPVGSYLNDIDYLNDPNYTCYCWDYALFQHARNNKHAYSEDTFYQPHPGLYLSTLFPNVDDHLTPPLSKRYNSGAEEQLIVLDKWDPKKPLNNDEPLNYPFYEEVKPSESILKTPYNKNYPPEPPTQPPGTRDEMHLNGPYDTPYDKNKVNDEAFTDYKSMKKVSKRLSKPAPTTPSIDDFNTSERKEKSKNHNSNKIPYQYPDLKNIADQLVPTYQIPIGLLQTSQQPNEEFYDGFNQNQQQNDDNTQTSLMTQQLEQQFTELQRETEEYEQEQQQQQQHREQEQQQQQLQHREQRHQQQQQHREQERQERHQQQQQQQQQHREQEQQQRQQHREQQRQERQEYYQQRADNRHQFQQQQAQLRESYVNQQNQLQRDHQQRMSQGRSQGSKNNNSELSKFSLD